MHARRRPGFTLIELLVAVALMVVLTGIVVFVFSKAVQVFMVADARAQIFQNVRSGVDMIRRDLMSAVPLLKDDNVSSNLQRIRVENGSYTNTKWSTGYPSDVLKVWNVTSQDASGNSSSVYVKYWLDTAASKETPVLKRKSSPVDTSAAAFASGTGWSNPAATDVKAITAASDLTDELMQYVVGFDVEPFYPNSGGSGATAWSRDPYWNLSGDADALATVDPVTGSAIGNDLRDNNAAPALARLWLVQYRQTGIPTTTTDVASISAWAAGNFDVSSLPTATTQYYRRAVFAIPADQPSAANGWGTTTGVYNGRAVSALPKGLRLTFYVRDERSREQRAIQEVFMIPCWGS